MKSICSEANVGVRGPPRGQLLRELTLWQEISPEHQRDHHFTVANG